MGRESFAEKGLGTLRVNLLGPMKMAATFVDTVAASEQKKIVTLTSIVGSIGRGSFGGLHAYRSSRAAANPLPPDHFPRSHFQRHLAGRYRIWKVMPGHA